MNSISSRRVFGSFTSKLGYLLFARIRFSKRISFVRDILHSSCAGSLQNYSRVIQVREKI